MESTTSYWVCQGCSDRLKTPIVCTGPVCRRCTGVCTLLQDGAERFPTREEKQLKAIALRSLPGPTIRKVIQP